MTLRSAGVHNRRMFVVLGRVQTRNWCNSKISLCSFRGTFPTGGQAGSLVTVQGLRGSCIGGVMLVATTDYIFDINTCCDYNISTGFVMILSCSCGIARAVLEGLAHLHRHDVVHGAIRGHSAFCA